MRDVGRLYVIANDVGACKVGVSRRPERRMRQLQTGSPYRLRLAHQGSKEVEGAGSIEAFAHWLLKDSQAHGEWFRVSPAVAWGALFAACIGVAIGRRPEYRIAGPGRPRLNVRETKARLQIGSKERIVALVGENKMAAFIREAVDEKLSREEAARRKPD